MALEEHAQPDHESNAQAALCTPLRLDEMHECQVPLEINPAADECAPFMGPWPARPTNARDDRQFSMRSSAKFRSSAQPKDEVQSRVRVDHSTHAAHFKCEGSLLEWLLHFTATKGAQIATSLCAATVRTAGGLGSKGSLEVICIRQLCGDRLYLSTVTRATKALISRGLQGGQNSRRAEREQPRTSSWASSLVRRISSQRQLLGRRDPACLHKRWRTCTCSVLPLSSTFLLRFLSDSPPPLPESRLTDFGRSQLVTPVAVLNQYCTPGLDRDSRTTQCRSWLSDMIVVTGQSSGARFPRPTIKCINN